MMHNPVMPSNFGDPCESGYSTTTSSEEGTLQRGFARKQGGVEGVLKNPKFLEMVSKERATKNTEYSPVSLSPSPPLTFGIPDHIPSSFERLPDFTGLKNSLEKCRLSVQCQQEIDIAALQKFRDNFENIRTYQSAKPPKIIKPGCYNNCTPSPSDCRRNPIATKTCFKQSPPCERKSAFVVVKPRVMKPSETPSNYQNDPNIVYIPAHIDLDGVARPFSGKSKECHPAPEILSNEASRLRRYLEKAEAKDLKKVLERLVKSKDPSSIHAMTKIFPGSKFKSDAAHCVRCHKDFNPKEPGRCILPHPERMVTKVSQDSIGADFVCGCCNAAFRLIQMDFYEESTNALLTGHCYSGTHTTDPNSVNYRYAGGAAKSCEDSCCLEFYV